MTAKNSTLTIERLREVLTYDPKTGAFYRKLKDRRFRCGKMRVAGWFDCKGYLRIEIDGRGYAAHVLAWLHFYGAWPADQLDHINSIKSDNSIANLRECDTQQNCSGRGLRKDNAIGYKGVSKKSKNRWVARIRVKYRGICLGHYATPEDAAIAYDRAAIWYFGEFARTNRMLGLLV